MNSLTQEQLLEHAVNVVQLVRDVRAYYVDWTEEEITQEIAKLLNCSLHLVARWVHFAYGVLDEVNK